MMKLLLVILAPLTLSGCLLHRLQHGHHPPAPHKAAAAHVHAVGCGHLFHGGRWIAAETHAVAHGHVCIASCSHYRHGSSYYVVRGHVHGPACGHHLRGGVWIVVD
jgi:hypothetical protein